MNISFTSEAFKDYQNWSKEDKKIFSKIGSQFCLSVDYVLGNKKQEKKIICLAELPGIIQ